MDRDQPWTGPRRYSGLIRRRPALGPYLKPTIMERPSCFHRHSTCWKPAVRKVSRVVAETGAESGHPLAPDLHHGFRNIQPDGGRVGERVEYRRRDYPMS